MTKPHSTASEVFPAADERRPSVGRAVRGGLMAAIVVAGCYAAHGCGRWLAEWRRVEAAAAVQPVSAAELSPLAAALPVAGPWSFAERDWNLQSQRVSAGELGARFAALGETVVASGQELPAVDRQLVEMIDMLRLTAVERGENRIYRLDRPDIRAMLVARERQGELYTLAMGIAYPQAAGKWQLFVMTPPAGTAAGGDEAAPHLLPLPGEARRSSARHAGDGQLLLEFVSMESPAEALVSQWREAGWEVRPSGMGGAADFSFLCARGGEMMYAWSGDAGGTVRNLMLVRSEAGADTDR